MKYDFFVLYPVNPSVVSSFRDAFAPSGAKDDPSDAQTTTVVRVEAGRLRRRLKDYYEAEGANDPVPAE